MSNVSEIRRQFASEHGFVLPDYVCRELSRLTAELAEAKEGQRIDNEHAEMYKRESERLESALAARDVIIGVKDGALREALPSCDRDGCDKPALYEQTQRGHTWTECEEHADESIKLQPQYYLRYPLSKTALSIDPNEVAEAISDVRESLKEIENMNGSAVSVDSPNNHSYIAKRAGEKYDKALKGVK